MISLSSLVFQVWGAPKFTKSLNKIVLGLRGPLKLQGVKKKITLLKFILGPVRTRWITQDQMDHMDQMDHSGPLRTT